MLNFKQCRRIQQRVTQRVDLTRGFERATGGGEGAIHVGVVTFWEESGGARLNGGRDTFICGLLMHEQPGLISLQRSQEPGSEWSQADGKMFLFSSLKLFIKGSLLLKIARLQVQVGESTLRFVKKRLWSLNGDIPLFLLHFLSPFCVISRRRFRRPSGLTARGILTRVDRIGDERNRREEEKWEKLRQLSADFGN